MNEDYLWDKTGEDTEIANIEKSLLVFRYTEQAPPRLTEHVSVNASPLVKKASIWANLNWLRFPVAATVCAALVITGIIGLWLRTADVTSPNEVTVNFAKPINLVPDDSPVYPPSLGIQNAVPSKTGAPKQTAGRRTDKALDPPRSFVKTRMLVAAREKAPRIKGLTVEETYAYNKLMTALAITSYQFKQVKDKIQNLENQTATVESGK